MPGVREARDEEAAQAVEVGELAVVVAVGEVVGLLRGRLVLVLWPIWRFICLELS
jgi:Flp pilus assembly pilin Flp